jgi:hypothetical protein
LDAVDSHRILNRDSKRIKELERCERANSEPESH